MPVSLPSTRGILNPADYISQNIPWYVPQDTAVCYGIPLPCSDAPVARSRSWQRDVQKPVSRLWKPLLGSHHGQSLREKVPSTRSDSNFASGGEQPYCAMVSLQWRGYWYRHYECRKSVNEEMSLLAVPTTTGAGATSTTNLEEEYPAVARSASTSWPSFTSVTTPAAAASSTLWPSFTPVATPTGTLSNTSTGGGGGSGLDGTAKSAIGIISSVVVAVVAVVGLWYAKCAKRNSSRMRNLEERRLSHEIRRDSPSASRSLVLQRPGGVTMPGRSWGGQGFNLYVNELHIHNHGAGRR